MREYPVGYSGRARVVRAGRTPLEHADTRLANTRTGYNTRAACGASLRFGPGLVPGGPQTFDPARPRACRACAAKVAA